MFKNSKVNMVIALILAIALWSYVVYTINPVQSEIVKGIPVQLENEDVLNDRGLAVANTTAITVDLTVEGSRQVIAGISADDFTATADVSECIDGDNVLEIDIECEKDVSRTNDATLTVHVQVENIVSVEKEVRVEGDNSDEDSSDEIEYELLSSETVTVTGAESLCSSVEYVKAEVDSEISSEEENINVQLVPVSESGHKVINLKLSETTGVVKAVRYGLKEVSLKTVVEGEPANGAEYEGISAPETITIRGRHSVIDDIDEVSTQAVDLSTLTGSCEVTLVPVLPDGVTVSDKSLPLTANVSIGSDGAETIKIDSSDISLSGLGDGLKAEIETGSVRVKVTGASDVSASDISISADLEGLEEGDSSDVKLTLKYSGEGKAELLTDSIKVRIEKE